MTRDDCGRRYGLGRYDLDDGDFDVDGRCAVWQYIPATISGGYYDTTLPCAIHAVFHSRDPQDSTSSGKTHCLGRLITRSHKTTVLGLSERVPAVLSKQSSTLNESYL